VCWVQVPLVPATLGGGGGQVGLLPIPKEGAHVEIYVGHDFEKSLKVFVRATGPIISWGWKKTRKNSQWDFCPSG